MTYALLQELNDRANIIAHRRTHGMTEQALKDETELLDITATLDEHPDNYDGPCMCAACAAYCGEG